jgi:hypothetical protein
MQYRKTYQCCFWFIRRKGSVPVILVGEEPTDSLNGFYKRIHDYKNNK